MEDFNQIMASIMEAIDNAPEGTNVEEIIMQKTMELGLSADGQKELAETNSYLDAYNDMYAKLQNAKSNHEPRTTWLSNELTSIAQKYSLTDEQEEELIKTVEKACKEEEKEILMEKE